MQKISSIISHLLIIWLILRQLPWRRLISLGFVDVLYKRLKSLANRDVRAIIFRTIRIAVVLTILFPFPEAFKTIGTMLPIETRWTIGIIVSTLVLVYTPSVKERKDKSEKGANKIYIPRTKIERRFWVISSIFVSIDEELLYRCFLFFYLSYFIPNLTIGWVLLIASVFFGLGHLYQGLIGALFCTYFGAIMGLLYLASGNIIPSIIVHFFWNISLLGVWRKKDEKMVS